MAHSSHVKDYDFIRDLVTEMVYDRCFCDPGSREFVEFDSLRLKALSFPDKIPVSEIYSAEVGVRFSGDLRVFQTVIKLLPEETEVASALALFQNEELFYSKIAPRLRSPHLAKCYLADMGRYGRPVIVLEDLKVQGYTEVQSKLDEDHLEVWIRAIGTFHARGLTLRASHPDEFREFYAKLQEATFNDENRNDMPNVFLKTSPFRALKHLKSEARPDPEFIRTVEERLGENPYEVTRDLATEVSAFSTLCHGDLSRNNLLFKYDDRGKPVDVRLIDWQTTRFCPVGIDLGPIIFTNLGVEGRLRKVKRLLDAYLDTVEAEAPTIPREEVRKDIVAKLLFAYNVASFCVPYVDKDLVSLEKRETQEQFVEAVCSLGGDEADKELAMILYDLKALGTFD